jgi:sigma-B regulation protein RsbU (phosphoserine phosphatase)
MVFRRTSPEKFITFFLALYDPESGSVVYTNAGHNPGILVRRSGACELLGAHGPPLGLFPGKTYGSGTFTMGEGDLLALYTDGVTEAANPDDEEFGMARLVETLVRSRALSVAGIDAELAASLVAFTQGTPFGDDRTFVFLKRS